MYLTGKEALTGMTSGDFEAVFLALIQAHLQAVSVGSGHWFLGLIQVSSARCPPLVHSLTCDRTLVPVLFICPKEHAGVPVVACLSKEGL